MTWAPHADTTVIKPRNSRYEASKQTCILHIVRANRGKLFWAKEQVQTGGALIVMVLINDYSSFYTDIITCFCLAHWVVYRNS